MPFLALIDNAEVTFPSGDEVAAALRQGRLRPEDWIKDMDTEADWQPVADLFPPPTGARTPDMP